MTTDLALFLTENGFWIIALLLPILSFAGIMQKIRALIKELRDVTQVLDRFMAKLYVALDDNQISDEEYRELTTEAWALVTEIKDLVSAFDILRIFRILDSVVDKLPGWLRRFI